MNLDKADIEFQSYILGLLRYVYTGSILEDMIDEWN